MNRFDSRLTVVEQDLMATNSQHQLADGVIVKPTSTHSPLSGPQKKSNVAKRAVNDPSMCLKCSSACLNLNVHRSVSCSLSIGLTVESRKLELPREIEITWSYRAFEGFRTKRPETLD